MSLLARWHHKQLNTWSLAQLFTPFKASLDQVPVLVARGNRPLQMTFEDQLKILTYYHLEEHSSGRHLLQVLKQERFAATHIAPPGGIEKSAFFEAINSRGLKQMVHVYEDLQKQARVKLPIAKEVSDLGDLMAVDGISYGVVTDRFDLTAEQIALIYKLRWTIESFFAWWKRHLKVYHLIVRSPYGLLMQILAGLITYLLLAIYCHEQYGERVSIGRVREIRCKIRNETAENSIFTGLAPPGFDDLDFGPYATS